MSSPRDKMHLVFIYLHFIVVLVNYNNFYNYKDSGDKDMVAYKVIYLSDTALNLLLLLALNMFLIDNVIQKLENIESRLNVYTSQIVTSKAPPRPDSIASWIISTSSCM